MDDQLKVGGIRLEPAEVETALVSITRRSPRALVRLWQPEPGTNRSPVANAACRCGLGVDVPGVDRRRRSSVCNGVPVVRRWSSATDESAGSAPRDGPRRGPSHRGSVGAATGDHDCLHLLSGGKDSTYALYQLVERGWRVHALTLDNGFISEGAKENVRRSVADLGITHEFATHRRR